MKLILKERLEDILDNKLFSDIDGITSKDEFKIKDTTYCAIEDINVFSSVYGKEDCIEKILNLIEEETIPAQIKVRKNILQNLKAIKEQSQELKSYISDLELEIILLENEK